jgi:hypothetical protein
VGRGRRSRTIAALAALAALLATAPASAQLPSPEPQPASFAEPARIAFATEKGLHTMHADGSGRTGVIVEEGYQPAWSPDGRSIAFTRFSDDIGEQEFSEIWVAAADGSGARRLTRSRGGVEEDSPAWSPDGRRVAFVRLTDDDDVIVSSIVSVAAEGGDARTITKLRSRAYNALASPAWAPDGNSILVSRINRLAEDDQDFNAQLYSVSVSSGLQRPLLRGAREPAFSPSGDRIAYTAARPGCEREYCSEIYVANADGGGRRRLTDNESDEGQPSWSADGRRIAFHSNRNFPEADQSEVYSIEPDGSCLTWLTNGTAQSFDPAYQPGAERPTDPGGCGATPREPLIEPDLRGVPGYRRTQAWWLGNRFGNLLLIGGDVEEGIAFLDYGDCAAYEPAECSETFLLSSEPMCTASILYDANGGRVARHQGALVERPRVAGDDSASVYTGRTVVAFEGAERVPAGALDVLRHFGADAPPAAGLPLAELPLRFWRTLERTRAAVRKYGRSEARRRLRVGRTRMSDRLSLDVALRKLGPFGRLDCAR